MTRRAVVSLMKFLGPRLLGVALACIGCGGSSAPESSPDVALPAADAGADGAVAAADAAPSLDAVTADAAPAVDAAPSTAPRCGPAPYHLVRLGARNLMAPANERALAGVKITFKHCPGLAVVTDAAGKAEVNLTQGAETWFRFDADAFLPWVCGEMAIQAPSVGQGVVAAMLPAALASGLLPGYEADRPLVYAHVQAGRSADPEPCRAPDGVAITVKDHPEAKVLYRNVGSMATFAPGDATTTEGVALITGLGPGVASVQLQATKPGCAYAPAYGDANTALLLPILRAPLFDGALSYQVINPVR
jgi:hypothetical protein